MKYYRKMILSVLVLVSCLLSIVACSSKETPTFSQEDMTRTEDAKIVYEDDATRIVEVWENGICYRSEYNKKDNTIVLYKIVNGQTEESKFYDVNEVESAFKDKEKEKDIVYPTAAQEDTGRTEGAKIVAVNDKIRIAEGWENDVCYRVEFDKTEYTAQVYKIMNDQIVETNALDFSALKICIMPV